MGFFEYACICGKDWHQQIELRKAVLSWQIFHFCHAPLLVHFVCTVIPYDRSARKLKHSGS